MTNDGGLYCLVRRWRVSSDPGPTETSPARDLQHREQHQGQS